MLYKQIETLEDARIWFDNSGYANWKWYLGFDKGELIEFIYRNKNHFADSESAIKAFLIAQKEKPNDYGLCLIYWSG